MVLANFKPSYPGVIPYSVYITSNNHSLNNDINSTSSNHHRQQVEHICEGWPAPSFNHKRSSNHQQSPSNISIQFTTFDGKVLSHHGGTRHLAPWSFLSTGFRAVDHGVVTSQLRIISWGCGISV